MKRITFCFTDSFCFPASLQFLWLINLFYFWCILLLNFSVYAIFLNISVEKAFCFSLQSATYEVSTIQNQMEKLEKVRLELADYFCEDRTKFKLETCLITFHRFCDSFVKAVKVRLDVWNNVDVCMDHACIKISKL